MKIEDMLDEQKQLEERIRALINFEAGDPARREIGDDEEFALKVQLQSMRTYLKALKYRIAKIIERNA